MATRKRAWLFAAAALSLLGCPGGSGDGTTASSSKSSWNPITCVSSTSFGDCSMNDLQDWADCELENCKPVLDACYGPQFRSGVYDGPCATFMECARKCTCDDSACVAACPLDSACQGCLDTTSCDEPGACDLMCDLTPMTPDKTCDDVKRCCPGLPEALRADCVEEANRHQGMADGQASCAGIYPFYAVASSSCD